ncbi:MAG: UDPGP type 1 family protein [Clostridiales bacterium]|nr:UDPGP type 1 family protein [Clostridiales bacterium]
MNLNKYNQEHLMTYFEELSNEEKEVLKAQINNLNLELITRIYNNKDNKMDLSKNKVSPLIAARLNPTEQKKCFEIGLDSIRKGEVAVVLMAGGQGTRLGHIGPKGTYDIGLPSHKSLFALQCDRLIRLHQMTGQYIKWYIMTSDDNHQESIEHFEENNYFGYDKKYIHFFKQDRLPLVLENGKIAMKSKYEINLAANGNGGVFSSLDNHGLLKEMSENKVKWVFLYGVDNAIAKVADPAFVGFTIQSNKSIASKSVDKVTPEEKVGVICYRNNHPDIVEYSELPDDLRYERDSNNELVYRNGNIVSHIFSLDFLNACAKNDIIYHTAHKKVSNFVNGQLDQSNTPNGYKFELFLFDMFKFSDDMAVMSVNREEEFSPVKNKSGNDSPETAKNMILNLHHKWLIDANFDVPHGLEVNTKLSYNGEDLFNLNLQDITFG